MKKNLPPAVIPGLTSAWRQAKRCYLALGLLFLTCLLAPGLALAQIAPPQPQYFKGSGTGSNAFPFKTNSVKRSQHLYLANDLPGALPGNIIRIYVRSSEAGTVGTYTDFRIRLGQTVATAFPGTASTDFFTNLTTVYTAPSFSLSAPAADAWVPIDLQIPFLFDPNQTLIVEFEMATGSGGFNVRTSTGPSAPNHKRLTATSLTATTGSSSAIWTDFGIDVGPSAPCSGTPTGGNAVSSVTAVCPNTPFQLALTGNTFATGITFQWQSSANGTTGWTDIPGATNPGYLATQTATTHYRARLNCGTAFDYSQSVMVTTNATPTSGTFTINKNSAPSATNFQTFAAAIASIECGGVNGPTVFNVVANSGPYNEAVVIPFIPGTSATNTVTFNGNNNILTFANTTSSRSVVRLDGADFVNLNNFNIQATDLTYGWGFHLHNGANNNTITNNTITIASTSTTESNSAGVVFSNSTTSVTTAGNTGNNNVISNNTITGGYKGIHLNHEITTASNNELRNNIITDFYADGIKVNAANGTLVEGNDISRPTRATVTTFSGVEISGNSLNTVISKNRIHNTHGGASSKTGIVYGLFFTAADAPVGSPNIAKNNLIYDISGTGTVYGIYNTSSNGTHLFHNTIYIDNPLNTGTVRGFYQTTLATDIKFINNIVYLNAGTSGTKHALYFGTTTSTIESNNNVLYLDPAGTNSHVGYYSTNFTTLANWKTANSGSFDQNSIAFNPNFVSPANGNFLPSNVLVNNTGQPLPAVTDDINGNARSAAAPDPGAYEFSLSAVDAAITAIVSPNSVCGLTNQEVVTITIANFGNTPLTSVPVSYQIGSGTPVTATFTGNLTPGASTNYSFTTPADLSATGSYNLTATASAPNDGTASNNSVTKVITNSRFASLPQLNFETAATGIASMRVVTNTRSGAAENPAASLGTGSTKGLILDAVANTNWQMPVGLIDPWNSNLEHLAAAYICFDPQGAANPTTPLWLSFDLKQLFKTANANTNFRITVNGTQVGPTYRPPFAGTPINWQKIYVDLTPYKNLPGIELGFESSTAESFANGTANLIDNIQIVRLNPTGTKETLPAASLSVYPNPSNGAFTVSLPQSKNFELEVTDLTGKVISRQQVSASQTNVDISKMAKGVYLLKVTTAHGAAVKRVVVE